MVANQPVGPSRYTYQKPATPEGLAPIGEQDFNGNNVAVALRCTF